VLALGRCQLEIDGVVTDLTRSQRRLVARLAAAPERAVSLSDLYDAIWPGAAPPSARAAVHNQISRLRGLAGAELIATVADGYRLTVATDVDELRVTVREAEMALASDPARALALAEHARSLPSGSAFADLADSESAAAVCSEVDGLLAAAADLEVAAALALGLGTRALTVARQLASGAPHDEERAARLAQALALAGRRGEALEEIARVRRALRTDLGLAAGVALDRLEATLRGGATPPVAGPVRDDEIDDVLAAVNRGDGAIVIGDDAAAVGRVLGGVRDLLLGRGDSAVAMVRVQGYRDVAVAALLDVLDLLGIDPVPALGPVGTFVPAMAELAQQRPVALLVEQFDAAGPSTRRVLLEAAQLEGVALVAGARSGPTDGFAAVIEVADGHDDARVPGLRRRFAALSPAVRDVLIAVAVAGDDVPIDLLGRLGVADALDDAVAEQLLTRTADDRAAFCDGALAAVVQADTPSGVQQELHHALGHLLRHHNAREQAAQHLLAAAAIEPPAAVAAAGAAAAAATEAGAHEDAAAWLEQAIAVCGDERTRVALQIRRGDALRLAGDPGHVEVLRTAADHAERLRDEELLGEATFALLALGGTTVSTTTHPDVEAVMSRALANLRDERQVALVQAAGSLAYSMTGRADRSRHLFLQAEAARVPPAVRIRVLPFAYLALGLPGDLDARRRHADELLTLAQEQNEPAAIYEGLHLALTVDLQDANGAGVRARHASMLELVDRVGDIGRRWALHYTGAALAHLDGDLDESERLTQAAFTQFAPVSPSRAAAVLYGQLFGLRIAQARLAELAPALEQLVADQPGVPAWNAALALSVAQTDPPRALASTRRALMLVQEDFSWLAAHLVGARAVALAARAGVVDTELLDRYRRRLEPWSGRVSWQGTCSYGPVDTTLALLAATVGDDERARRLAAAAHEQCDRLAAPVFVEELAALGLR
jgi:DNA-binding SARP family transcriptional activator